MTTGELNMKAIQLANARRHGMSAQALLVLAEELHAAALTAIAERDEAQAGWTEEHRVSCEAQAGLIAAEAKLAEATKERDDARMDAEKYEAKLAEAERKRSLAESRLAVMHTKRGAAESREKALLTMIGAAIEPHSFECAIFLGRRGGRHPFSPPPEACTCGATAALAARNFCSCGHPHVAGVDGEDDGCRDPTCHCVAWRSAALSAGKEGT